LTWLVLYDEEVGKDELVLAVVVVAAGTKFMELLVIVVEVTLSRTGLYVRAFSICAP
jgi:hypothetical protein